MFINILLQLSLVCDRWVYATWIKNCYRLGLVIGSLLTGSCADRFGMKVTLGVFMSLHCFTGLLVISITNQEILMFFIFFNGVFSVTIFSLPLIIGKNRYTTDFAHVKKVFLQCVIQLEINGERLRWVLFFCTDLWE